MNGAGQPEGDVARPAPAAPQANRRWRAWRRAPSRHGDAAARGWWATAVGAYLVLCLPLLVVDVPPLTDYPNHMARMEILAHLDSDPFLMQVYRTRWEIIPDLAIDTFMPWLVTIVPANVAGRMLLAIILLLDMAGAVACAAAFHGRRTWWSLGAALVAYNMSFLMGFLSFNLTLAAAMAAAAAWMRLRTGKSALATAIFGGSAAGVLFVGHLLGLLFFLLLVGSAETPLLVRRLRHAGPTAASRLRALMASWPLAFVAVPPAILYAATGVSAALNRPRWPIWSDRLIEAMAGVLNYDWTLDVLTAALIGAFLAACILFRRLRIAPGAALGLGAVAVLVTLLPHDFKGGSYFAMRLGVMLGFLVFVCFRPQLAGRSALVIGIGFSLLFVVRTAVVVSAWWNFRIDVANARALIQHVAAGDRLAELAFEPEDVADYFARAPIAWRLSNLQRTNIHLMAMAVIERRAFWPTVFANPDQQPLVLYPQWQALAESTLRLPSYADLVRRRSDGNPAAHNPFCAFNWIVFQSAWAEPRPETLAPDWLVLVASNRTAALYRVPSGQNCRNGS